jgi:hypothetical protein
VRRFKPRCIWFDRFNLARKKTKIIGITPAMPLESLKFMMDAFPKRAFDVGITTRCNFGRWYGNTRHDRLLQHLLYFSTKSLSNYS